MNSGIYNIYNLVDFKNYVGSSIHMKKEKDAMGREYEHFQMLKKGTHTNSHLQRAWNKYVKEFGEEVWVFEILEYCERGDLTEEEFKDYLIAREDYWQVSLDSRHPDKGYNLLSADRHEISEETRKKMSANMMGNQWNIGRRHSEETKAKISASNMGRTFSKDTRAKIGAAHKGMRHTEEAKEKISSAKRGHIPWMAGKTHTEEAKAKISAANKGNTGYWLGKSRSEETKAKISATKRAARVERGK